MSRTSNDTAMEPGLPSFLTCWRTAPRSRSPRTVSPASLERLEDRTLLSHGLDGGPGPLLQEVAIATLANSDDLTNGHRGGGSDRSQGGFTALPPSGGADASNPGGPGRLSS